MLHVVGAEEGLSGGLGRFIPGNVGANHGRLRHVGWEKCCHGLAYKARTAQSAAACDTRA